LYLEQEIDSDKTGRSDLPGIWLQVMLANLDSHRTDVLSQVATLMVMSGAGIGKHAES
jgi:hypothetical protein